MLADSNMYTSLEYLYISWNNHTQVEVVTWEYIVTEIKTDETTTLQPRHPAIAVVGTCGNGIIDDNNNDDDDAAASSGISVSATLDRIRERRRTGRRSRGTPSPPMRGGAGGGGGGGG